MKKLSILLMIIMAAAITGCSSQANSNNVMVDENTTSVVEVQEMKPEAFDMDIKNNSLAISPDEKIAIVSNSTIDKLNVYDLQSNKLIGELDDFVTPRNIAFSKDGKYFYISDSSYGNIREFDASTLKETRKFDLEKGVFGFTLNNKGDKIFANNQDKSTVTLIDLNTGKVEKIIEGFSQPRQGIVIDKSDKYVYVTNFKGDDVRVLNADTLEIERTITGIPAIRAISVDDDNKYLYAASSSSNTINVVDLESGEIVKSITVGQEPYGAALSKNGDIILSGEKGSNSISVIDTNTLEVKRTIEGLKEPRQAIVYSQNEGQAYVLNEDLSISVIDYLNGSILRKIK